MMRILMWRRCLVMAMSLIGAMPMLQAPDALCQSDGPLRFIPDVVDFGIIDENEGKVSRQAKAVNISSDSTFIVSARTGCGCTVADYPDTMLAPGDTATVTLTYDSSNRPGKFLKSVKFFTGKERVANPIKFKGTVIPNRSSVERTYPAKAGALRLTTAIVNAGETARTEARPLFVSIYNDSERRIPLLTSTDHPALEAALLPDTIDPYSISTLSLMLKGRNLPKNENEYAYRVYLIDSEKGDTIIAIPVGGIIKDN